MGLVILKTRHGDFVRFDYLVVVEHGRIFPPMSLSSERGCRDGSRAGGLEIEAE